MEPDPLTPASRRVEAYLDQILAPLARRLSPFHQEELRRELREHLWARVDAYRELGQTEEEAVTEALRQFGGAKNFLRQWRREWTQAPQRAALHRLTLRDVYEAGRWALGPSLAGIAAAMLPFTLLVEAPSLGLHGARAATALGSVGTALFWGLVGFAFLLLPVWIGTRQGRRAPQNAGAGIVAALTAEMIVTGLVYRLVAWDSPDMAAQSLFTILSALVAAWVPTAGGAAAVSGWWTRRSEARQLA